MAGQGGSTSRERLPLLAARLALVFPFLASAMLKLADPAGATAEMQHWGLEPAGAAAAVVIAVQLVGSLAVVTGRGARWGALALALFTGAATLIAHSFWTIDEPVARAVNRNIFFEHVAILGGLALAALFAERGR